MTAGSSVRVVDVDSAAAAACQAGLAIGLDSEPIIPNGQASVCLLGDKGEYGDWQTSMDLALRVCRLLRREGINPQVVIEPTCGKGNFVLAALQVFDRIEQIHGIEICRSYLDQLNERLARCCADSPGKQGVRAVLYNQNVFAFDFAALMASLRGKEILVVGNPPWATNSKLSGQHSANLPEKSNFKRHNGLEAIMGKSNFDISEYIFRQIAQAAKGANAHVALLIKNSVIKNLVYGQRTQALPIDDIRQYGIDARREFGVSVAASLLYCRLGRGASDNCAAIDMDANKELHRFGWVGNSFVSDICAYRQHADLEGASPLVWRSGIKHDCAKVMELTFDGQAYRNGFGEIVDIEQDMVYPLLKSSDLQRSRIDSTDKYVIVTQRSTSDDTNWIKDRHPKAYQYLLRYADRLDSRGSRIYKGRARFCMFGVGPYSFKPYKIAVSGLYKSLNFALVMPIANKCVMLDDTCYMLSFDSLSEAMAVLNVLNGDAVRSFIESIMFVDAKRVVSKDLLMRVDLTKVPGFNLSAVGCGQLRDSGYGNGRHGRVCNANDTPRQFTLF